MAIVRFATALAAAGISLHLMTSPALACGFGEAPTECGGATGEADARWMLKRVVAAIKADEPHALHEFAHGEGGFRTVDTYVFCVGPDGVMSAHPSPLLQGQDVNGLHDETGNYFIATMLKTAKPGEVSQISYLFPRPGSTTATQKTTYYTKAADQVCGVGVYEGDDNGVPPASADELTAIRRHLDAKIPPADRADWNAFLQAMDKRESERVAALAQAREQLQAVVAVLGNVVTATR